MITMNYFNNINCKSYNVITVHPIFKYWAYKTTLYMIMWTLYFIVYLQKLDLTKRGYDSSIVVLHLSGHKPYIQ